MPTALNVNDIWQLRLGYSTPQQAAINRVNYLVTQTTGGSVTDDDAEATFSAALPTLIKALISQEATYVGLSLQRRFPLPPTATTPDYTGTAVGTV